MPELSAAAQTRINTLIEEIKNGIGKEITALLQEINATRLANKGKLSRPVVDLSLIHI